MSSDLFQLHVYILEQIQTQSFIYFFFKQVFHLTIPKGQTLAALLCTSTVCALFHWAMGQTACRHVDKQDIQTEPNRCKYI